jgi:hypothetical protein
MELNSKPNSERSCRFCFEATITLANPLVSPCECKGSQQFIHLYCLNRWRQQNPSTNMINCFVCKTPYTIELIYRLEQLPQLTYLYLPLQYPYVWFIIYHYVAMVFSVSLQSHKNISPVEQMKDYELLFHGLFFLFALFHFKVNKKSKYLRHWGREYRWVAFPFHLLILFFSSYYPNSYTLLTSGLYLPIHWRTHIMILREMNIEDNLENT